ncbi:MAG: ABC transporter ATP-binding protein [Methanomicrobiales archaeon]
MENIIEIKNFYYQYPNQKDYCLQNINLNVKKGEFIFITGKSGCGKSTLARSLNGTIPHIIGGNMEGNISINGKNTLDFKVNDLAADVGFIFQNPESQFFTLKVEDEIAFGPENLSLKKDEIYERIEWALNEVEMSDWRYENVYNLSEGQKQRVAIAANLSLLPEILVLDEPTSNLDPEGAHKLFIILEKLKKQGKTIILIDHRTRYALKSADKVLIMDKGKIVMETGPEILEDATVREEFGIRNPKYVPSTENMADYYHNHEDKIKGGEKPVLEIENLNFTHSNGFKLKEISFSLYSGEVLGIVGNNGSGKTTLANLIAGLLKTKDGIINLDGEEFNSKKLKNGYKVGMVLQNPDHQLFMDSVYSEVSFGLEFLGLPSSELEDHIKNVLESMNLWSLKNRHPHSLSGGEKQRTLISALMVREPDLLILDEPTTGMDGYHMEKLVEMVNNLSKSGVSIILISHDLEFIEKTCNRYLFMKEGFKTSKDSVCHFINYSTDLYNSEKV